MEDSSDVTVSEGDTEEVRFQDLAQLLLNLEAAARLQNS